MDKSFENDAKQFHFPPGWDDEVLMSVFFTELGPKEYAPDEWDTQVNWWIKAIKSFASQILQNPLYDGKRLTFSQQELTDTFTRKNGLRPQCIGGILKELHKRSEISGMETYKKEMSWMEYFTSVASGWLGYEAKHPEENIVMLHCVKKYAESFEVSIKRNCNERSDYIMWAKEIKEKLQEPLLDSDLTLTLHYLKKHNKVQIVTMQDGKTAVKFSESGEHTKEVDVTDLAIANLKHELRKVEARIKQFQDRVDRLKLEAKKYLKTKNKSAAEHKMKVRNAARNKLLQQRNISFQLENVIHNLNSANSNKTIVDALKRGQKALDYAHKLTDIDEVDNTMLDMQQSLADQDAVSQALGGDLDNMDDLEKELEELDVASDQNIGKESEGVEENLDSLPDPPSDGDRILKTSRANEQSTQRSRLVLG